MGRMRRLAAMICVSLCACTTEVTNVYVVSDATAAADTADAGHDAETADTMTAPQDTGTQPDTAPPPYDALDPDATPRVRCEIDAGVFVGCNGVYAKLGARIHYAGADGVVGDCWSASEDAGSPYGNCVPDPPCTPTDGGGTTCISGNCIVEVPGWPAKWGKCR